MSTKSEERAILSLLGEYCDSIDRGDLDACAALFAEGAWGIAGDLAEGADAVRAVLDNVILYDGIPQTRHLMSNLVIDTAPDGQSATATCCITVMQGVQGQFPLQAIFIGTYHDRLHKQGNAWTFTERVIVPDLVGDMAFHRGDMA